MLENYITQVGRPKGVSSEREAFVSRAAQASAAVCNNKSACREILTCLKELDVTLIPR